jgi:hypothetical protein
MSRSKRQDKPRVYITEIHSCSGGCPHRGTLSRVCYEANRKVGPQLKRRFPRWCPLTLMEDT